MDRLRTYVRVERPVIAYWRERAMRSAYAPGGAGRERDRRAFLLEVYPEIVQREELHKKRMRMWRDTVPLRGIVVYWMHLGANRAEERRIARAALGYVFEEERVDDPDFAAQAVARVGV